MGFSEDQQKRIQEQRLQLHGIRNSEESMSTAVCRSQEDDFVSCCQENGDTSCCQNRVLGEKINDTDAIDTEAKLSADNKSDEAVISQFNSSKGASRKHRRSTPTWLDSWEQEDTYAALAVICAAVSVFIAYSCYKQLR